MWNKQEKMNRGGERRRRKEHKGGGDKEKETFKGVNSQSVTIPGVVSRPPWYSPDNMLLIRKRNGMREVKGRVLKGRRRDKEKTLTAIGVRRWRRRRGLRRCEASGGDNVEN